MTTPEPGAQQPHDRPSSDVPDAVTVPGLPGEPAVSHEQQALFDARTAVGKVKHTRSRATYAGWIVGLIVTILLLIFIIRNPDSQEVDLVFGKVSLPVGVSLLIAAIAGAIITLAVTGARIFQLQRALNQVTKAAGRKPRNKKD